MNIETRIAKLEYDARMKDSDGAFPLPLYHPHKKQRLFHAAARTYRIILAIAGTRSGKSIAGANEVIKNAKAKRSRWAFVAPTYADAREILDETLLNYLPQGIIKDLQKQEHRITLTNGSKILWRSAEEPERIRALGDLDGAWLDEAEQDPKLIFDLISARVARRSGKILITTSPQKWFGPETRKRASWIFELLADRGITLTPGVNEHYAGDLAALNWTLSDNPHFPPEEILRLRERHGPLWSSQELDGLYVDLYAEGVFKAEWFRAAPRPETFSQKIIAYDPAISERSGADYSVAQAYGRAGDSCYCFAESRGRWNYVEQKIRLKALCDEHRPHTVLIEDVAFQRALITDLKRDGLPVIGIRPDGDKAARAARLSGPLSAGKVLFAEEILTPSFLNEFVAFPNWAQDDRVDTTGYAIEYLLTHKLDLDRRPIHGRERVRLNF